MKHLLVELKICEGCGVLWLRSGIMDGVYCSGCSLRLSKFPERRKRPGGRPRLARPSRCGVTHLRTGGTR